MALNRQAFTRGGNAPDVGALANPIRAAIGDPFYVGVQLSSGGIVTVYVDKPTAWQATEITAVQTAVTAAADATPQTDAQNFIDQMPIWAQALALALVDEINRLRTQPTTVFSTVSAAQALNAIRAKAGTLS
jgi:hypothetical protein